MGTEDKRNYRYRRLKKQCAQRTRRTVRIEDYWNSGYRGPEE